MLSNCESPTEVWERAHFHRISVICPGREKAQLRHWLRELPRMPRLVMESSERYVARDFFVNPVSSRYYVGHVSLAFIGRPRNKTPSYITELQLRLFSIRGASPFKINVRD